MSELNKCKHATSELVTFGTQNSYVSVLSNNEPASGNLSD